MDHFDLVILGCGPAGEKAATQAAWYGRRVAVVERAPRPGGAMVNTGTIPSKTLRETALLCSAFRRRPIPGLSLAFEKNLSIAGFMSQRHLVQMEEHDRIESSFDRHDVQIVPGHGRIIDPHTVEVTAESGAGTMLHADNILIATGSSPFRPSHIPFDDHRVVDADSILEIDHLPKSLAIVGGGVIGSEYACIFAEVGVEVTLIDPRDRIMPFLDDDCIAVLSKAMESAGVQFRFGSGVASVNMAPDMTGCHGQRPEGVGRAHGHVASFALPTPVAEPTCAGSGTRASIRTPHQSVSVLLENGRTIECDTLLWAAGRTGNTSDLGLESVGITPDKRGQIAVNEHYQTAVPSIWAAGDVVGPPALTSTSMEQGRVAACHMFNIDFKKAVASVFPLGIFTIPAVAMVGLAERDALAQGRDIIAGHASYRLNARSRMYRENEGLLKLIFDAHTRALLGAAMVGEQATELIHIAQSAISAGEGIDYFINACFNYPSIAELYKYATYDALQQMPRRQPATLDRAA